MHTQQYNENFSGRINVISMILSVKKLFSSFWIIFKSEETKGLLIVIFLTLISGACFYSTVEHLNPLNAFYLSFVTLTTIGYGDIHPVTDFGKIFTMLYSTVGIGLMTIFVATVAKAYMSTKANKRRH